MINLNSSRILTGDGGWQIGHREGMVSSTIIAQLQRSTCLGLIMMAASLTPFQGTLMNPRLYITRCNNSQKLRTGLAGRNLPLRLNPTPYGPHLRSRHASSVSTRPTFLNRSVLFSK
jgi:hypothetical protein